MVIPVRGEKIFIRREGTGRPIVLIHGLGTPSVWTRVWDPLSRSHDLVNIHLPGFGSSEPSTTPCSVRDHALLVQDVIDHLRLHDAVLMGISYGGQVAATLAAMRPERVSGLVIICGAGLMRRYRILRWEWLFRIVQAAAAKMLLRSEKTVRRMNKRLYVDAAHQPPEIVTEFLAMVRDPGRRREWFQCVRNGAVPAEGFGASLASIQLPTLILWGREDRVIPVKCAERFREAIPGSIMEVIDDCGHALPLERPDEMCGALSRFLARQGGTTAGA